MASFFYRLTGVCSFLSNPGSKLQENDSLSLSLAFSLFSSSHSVDSGKKAVWWNPDKHADGICQKAGRGINKRCVGREMKLEVLFWCADPGIGPVWLIKAPLLPFCLSAGMCCRNEKRCEWECWDLKGRSGIVKKNFSKFFYTEGMLALGSIFLKHSASTCCHSLFFSLVFLPALPCHAFRIKPSASRSPTCQCRWMCVGTFSKLLRLCF